MFKNSIKYFMRNGYTFHRYLKEVEENQKLTSGQILEYRHRKLMTVIRDAYEGVPYYQDVFRERGLKPSDIKSEKDLYKLPIINKEIVKNNFERFKNTNFKGMTFKGMTSGTSGSPAVFLRDLDSINYENAFVWRHYRWADKLFRSRRIVIRGDLIFPSTRKNPPYWKKNRITNEFVFSSYHMSEETLPLYIEQIKKFEPFDLHAYPSTAYILAEYCLRKKIDLPIPYVFTSSESIAAYQREVIEKAFSCKVFDWYGNAERTAAIAQCKFGTYHEMSDYAIHEFEREGDNDSSIIGTTLFNRAMPLIRYRVGDIIELDDAGCCECGKPFPIIKRIVGRQTSYLLTPEGRKVTIYNHIPRGVDHLVEMQFIQNSEEEIQVLIAVEPGFGIKQHDFLLERLKKYISPSTHFRIERIEKIPRSKQGKLQMVKQNCSSALQREKILS